jgi:hypothetical protein
MLIRDRSAKEAPLHCQVTPEACVGKHTSQQEWLAESRVGTIRQEAQTLIAADRNRLANIHVPHLAGADLRHVLDTSTLRTKRCTAERRACGSINNIMNGLCESFAIRGLVVRVDSASFVAALTPKLAG